MRSRVFPTKSVCTTPFKDKALNTTKSASFQSNQHKHCPCTGFGMLNPNVMSKHLIISVIDIIFPMTQHFLNLNNLT